MPIAPLDDTTSVDYLVAGERTDEPDLVLIHGTGGTAETNWGHLLESLAVGRRVIAPNLAGSGATRDHGGRLELEELMAQVLAAADHDGSDRYDIAGFSLGAVVGAAIAAEYPRRVRRLILIAGWQSSDDPRVQLQFGLWQRLFGSDRRALAEHLTLTGFSPHYLAARPGKVVEAAVETTFRTMPAGLDRQAELDTRIDITGELPRIRSNTLVIGCQQDQMVPVEHARALVAPIRWSDYVEFDSGHLLIFERPDELVRVIRRFVEKPDRRQRPRPESPHTH